MPETERKITTRGYNCLLTIFYIEKFESTNKYRSRSRNLICPVCGIKTRGIIKQKCYAFMFFNFLVNSFSVKEKRTFCGFCNANFSGMYESKCGRCGISMLIDSRYCVNCRNRKYSSENLIMIDRNLIETLVENNEIPPEEPKIIMENPHNNQ